MILFELSCFSYAFHLLLCVKEMRDREMAMKLADELANGGATPPAPAGAPASSGAVVYGTPAGSQFSYPGIDLMGGGGGSRPVSGHPPAFAPLSQAAASPYPTLNVSHSPAGGQAPVPMPVPAAPAAAVPPGGSAGVYQYNNSSYNMAAAPAPAPPAQPQYNIPQQHSSAMDFNTKVRLVASLRHHIHSHQLKTFMTCYYYCAIGRSSC